MAEQTSNTEAQATPATPATPALQTSTSAANEGQSQARSFTQSELDGIISERAKRAADTATKKILDALGVSSVDELSTIKSTLEDSRKRQEADMSESQRLQKALETEKAAFTALKTELDAERQARKSQTIDTAIRQAASGVIDADLLVLHARTAHSETVQSLLSDSGAVDTKKVTALLTTIKAEKPHLWQVAQTPGTPSNSGGKITPSAVQIDFSRFKL